MMTVELKMFGRKAEQVQVRTLREASRSTARSSRRTGWATALGRAGLSAWMARGLSACPATGTCGSTVRHGLPALPRLRATNWTRCQDDQRRMGGGVPAA